MPKSEPEKVDLKSMDVVEDQKRKLKEVFPNFFNEDKVDFDRLRLALGEDIDAGAERYGMIWPGKAECMRVIQQPSIGTLKPVEKESIDFDVTENLFIEGDNLEVLKLLQNSYYGKIKMIYIDPPYNTGKEFIYPDKYSESLETYLSYTGQVDAEGKKFSTNTEADGRFHSKWLNMMYPRLFLARNLLREDGVIFISIDDNEVDNLKKLCNEVFGEENFIAQIVWEKMYTTKNDAAFMSTSHEYVICFCKSIANLEMGLLERTAEMDSRYKNTDNDPRGPWKPIPLYADGESKSGRYIIKAPGGKEFEPRPDMHWRYREDDMKALMSDKRIYFGKDGNSQPNLKRFLSEVQQGVKARSLWAHEDVGSNDSAKKELRTLFAGDDDVFDFPKPATLINRMLTLATKATGNDIVLDFFAGSGTTAQAVLELNRQEDGNRKFILVQLPELCAADSGAFKKGYKTLAEIGKERVRRAIENIKNKQKENKGEKTLFDKNKSEKGETDLGFKVFKLDKSNFKVWESKVEEKKGATSIEKQLELHINHIDPKATTDDILYELLLKSGFPLATRVEEKAVAGKKVYSIENGALLICLEKELTNEVITEMSRLEPARVVCLDQGFSGNDQLKTNAVQILKSHGVNDFRTV